MKKILTLLMISVAPAASAGYLDDVGFSALKFAYGGSLADGSGVLPTLVEAAVEIDDMGTAREVWRPDPDDIEFGAGLTFTDKTPVPTELLNLYSPHATGSARRMVGTTTSMTPAVSELEVYDADDWLVNFLLTGVAATAPLASDSRVANHSWVGNFEDAVDDLDALRRVDWLIERDEFVQVVGNTNGAPLKPLLANSYNAITVGRTDGSHSGGTLALDGTYIAGRANPDIVAPLGTTSAATSVVTSAVTLLVDTAQSDPGLSLEADLVPRSPTAAPVKSAAASEVIKAVLMAGADRTTDNPTAANITDYRQGSANSTTNGLDVRFGAGQLNIQTSHEILASGEQNSVEDGDGTVLWTGFDYDPAFGGDSANAVANYEFRTDALAARVTASLVWNLSVDEGGIFEPTPRLYNLDLELWKLDAGGDTRLVSSASLIDNTENIWSLLDPNSDYALRVVHAEAQPFSWDYALAWRIHAVPVPGALPLMAAALAALLGIRGRRTPDRSTDEIRAPVI